MNQIGYRNLHGQTSEHAQERTQGDDAYVMTQAGHYDIEMDPFARRSRDIIKGNQDLNFPQGQNQSVVNEVSVDLQPY